MLCTTLSLSSSGQGCLLSVVFCENESNIISMQLNTLFLLVAISYYFTQIVNTIESKHASIINAWGRAEILPSRFF